MMENTKLINAVRGSLIGGAAGDALGYAVEFMCEGSIFHEYGKSSITSYDLDFGNGKGRISDDTQMTLFTAEAPLPFFRLKAWTPPFYRKRGFCAELLVSHPLSGWLSVSLCSTV